MRLLVSARRNHDRACTDRLTGCFQLESTLRIGFDAGDVAMLLERDVERCRPRFEEGDQLLERHEAVRIRTRIGGPGEAYSPVRCYQAERIPAPGAPCLGHPATLEDDVIDSGLIQVPTGREARLAATDDRDVNSLGHADRILATRRDRPPRA